MRKPNVLKKQKPIYALICEGKNKTEVIYFGHFRERSNPYVLNPIPAKCTDIDGMFKLAKETIAKMHLTPAKGDKVFILTDADCSKTKIEKIKKLNEQNKLIQFVVSFPCFEGWFCLHFELYKHNITSKKMIEELRKHIPNYEKSKDYYETLKDKTDQAILNSKTFAQSLECANEIVGVYELVEMLIKEKEEQ